MESKEETKPGRYQASNKVEAKAPTGFKMRGQQVQIHHLMKAELAKFKKNRSWKKDQPEIIDVEHVHFFHTINSTGKAQKFTAAVGGHFHEVEWSIDSRTGEPVAKCGPPLKRVAVPGPDGLVEYENRPIEWYDKVGKMGKRGTTIVDNHTHPMSYLGSDEISADQIRATQTANRTALHDGMQVARETLAKADVKVTE